MKRERNSTLICALAALMIASGSGASGASNEHGHRDPQWGYETANGPQAWGGMSSKWVLCAEGLEQSPIDLADPTPIQLPAAVIRTPSGQEVEVLNQQGVISALDNGHTIQVNSKVGETMTIGRETYSLIQFHFHAPSEHTLKGVHFPMEIHFVYQRKDGALAVVGVFAEEGLRNPSIGALWKQLPDGPGKEATVKVPTEFANQIFSGDSSGAYHYRGSLTTPPCSEGVKWYIRSTPTQLSKEQVAAFTRLYDYNNRPVQRLNERTLFFDETPSVTIR